MQPMLHDSALMFWMVYIGDGPSNKVALMSSKCRFTILTVWQGAPSCISSPLFSGNQQSRTMESPFSEALVRMKSNRVNRALTNMKPTSFLARKQAYSMTFAWCLTGWNAGASDPRDCHIRWRVVWWHSRLGSTQNATIQQSLTLQLTWRVAKLSLLDLHAWGQLRHFPWPQSRWQSFYASLVEQCVPLRWCNASTMVFVAGTTLLATLFKQ